ncbi:MAG TPA: hypothetical protein VIV11_02790, partial [Kofleriaceae bacterium]
MAMSPKLMLASALLVAPITIASAQPGAESEPPPTDEVAEVFARDNAEPQAEILPPSAVVSSPPVVATRVERKPSPLATTRRLGGGIRLTGLSGIGALPGVNYGAEFAALVRYDELFGELG